MPKFEDNETKQQSEKQPKCKTDKTKAQTETIKKGLDDETKQEEKLVAESMVITINDESDELHQSTFQFKAKN